MRSAHVFVSGKRAGTLIEHDDGTYEFTYEPLYHGAPVSLTMPTTQTVYRFDRFPPFFDGLLPEGVQLDALLRQRKIDRTDYFSQLVAVGNDLVGAVTVTVDDRMIVGEGSL